MPRPRARLPRTRYHARHSWPTCTAASILPLPNAHRRRRRNTLHLVYGLEVDAAPFSPSLSRTTPAGVIPLSSTFPSAPDLDETVPRVSVFPTLLSTLTSLPPLPPPGAHPPLVPAMVAAAFIPAGASLLPARPQPTSAVSVRRPHHVTSVPTSFPARAMIMATPPPAASDGSAVTPRAVPPRRVNGGFVAVAAAAAMAVLALFPSPAAARGAKRGAAPVAPPPTSTTTTVDVTTAAVAMGAVGTSAVVLRLSSRRGKRSEEADAAAAMAAAERTTRATEAAESAARAEELRVRREAETAFLQRQAQEETDNEVVIGGGSGSDADAEESGEVDLLAELRKRVAAFDLEDLGDGADDAEDDEPPEEVAPRARAGDRGAAGSIVLERPGSGGGGRSGDEDGGDGDGSPSPVDGPDATGEVSEELRSSVDMLTRMWNASGGAQS